MKAGRRASVEDTLLRPSPRLLGLFRIYLRCYVRRHFHALRVAHAERLPVDARPLILCMNHPSWWDPLTGILLARFLLPAAEFYAPMDAAALAHYGIFKRTGMFPVEAGTRRGAAQFLRSSMEVLSRPGAALWMTPEGAFTDVRRRPLTFKPGLAALVARLPQVTVVPVAVEYAFWDERLPEVLVNIGEPVVVIDGTGTGLAAGATVRGGHRLEEAMTAAQDELAALGMARDASAFDAVLAGGRGVSGVYGLWQRASAVMRGRDYMAEHGSIRRP